MRELSLQELAQAATIVGKIAEELLRNPVPDLKERLSSLAVFLQASETKLIRLMNGEHPSESDPGVTQYGLVLYVIDSHHPVLQRLLHLPVTQITPLMLLQWGAEVEGPGVVDYEGSLLAVGKFEQLDAGWLFALIYYIALILGVKDVSSWAPFGSNPVTMSVPGGNAKIALVGDWGTGSWIDGMIEYPALQVINSVRALAPDYTIHLGDVYYAGTSGFLGSDEEFNSFVNLWAAGSEGSFMLNSNHEMYSGARGYFGRGLVADAFAKQQGTSYFALQSEQWILIGLDTAYFDKSLLFMNGALTDDAQKTFIKSLDTANKRIILLTHHNGTRIDGTAALSLWGDVQSALGRAPDFWYWGHVHNAIVYSEQSVSGQAGTRARCVGHGAIPFGIAYGLQDTAGNNIPSVEYFAHELLSTEYDNTDSRQANRVLNGFALLTLSQDAIKEEFFDQTGAVRWSSTTPLS